MKIGFRVDASPALGTGHAMRCRALARPLRRKGAEIVFFSRFLPDWLSSELADEGFRHIPLSEDRDEIESLIGHLTSDPGQPFDWLVVDHYGWGERQESAVAPYIRRLMVIDDLADRRHRCDLLLDQNDFGHKERRYQGLVPPSARLMLGGRYALLREEFAAWRGTVKIKDGRVRTLFVCFGGSDPTNETSKALEALDAPDFADLSVHVVIGRSHSRVEEIARRCESDPRIRLHIQSNEVARLLAESDLAVCAGGTMTWERYCMGLPGLVIAVADNQIEVAKAGQQAGVDWYLGESARVDAEAIRSALRAAMNDPDRIRLARRLAMDKVDGLGADRVVRAMLEPSRQERSENAERE